MLLIFFRSGGGCYPWATGKPARENKDIELFTDELLAGGFDEPVGMSFTDNTNELFVATRRGIVHYINLETGERKIFIDLQDEVNYSGDRGMMDVVTSPDYANTHQVIIAYVVDENPDDGQEPAPDQPSIQQVIRLEDLGNGVVNPEVKVKLIGGESKLIIPIVGC